MSRIALRSLAVSLSFAAALVPMSSDARLPAAIAAARVEPVAAAPTGDEAIDPSDLTSLREAAAARAAAEPTAANFRAKAELAERAGDWSEALAALDAERGALGQDDQSGRARNRESRARIEARQRGTVADEASSTHRAELDRKWAPPSRPLAHAPKPKPAAPTPVRDDRIVKKWYFWVTLGAIAASAAAITAIAIKAARDDKPDALDRRARLPGRGFAGPAVLRF